MKVQAIVAAFVASSLLSGCVSQQPLVSMNEAVAVCTSRTAKYEDTVYGPFQDYPDQWMVQDHYRSCVHAKSGSNPPVKYQSAYGTSF